MFVKFFSTCLMILISSKAHSQYLSWGEIEKKFRSEGINTKALGHIQCFFNKHEKSIFQKKIPTGAGGIEVIDRCDNGSNISVNSPKVFALIDYTVPSDQRRMFLVNRETGNITSMAVAHGRYDAGLLNTHLSYNKNSIKDAVYFSNEIDSNASSSGFFIAGLEYLGKFGRSLILHGLEEGINDNACERAVVIHKYSLMGKSKAHSMSSGCLMVDKAYINESINLLEGKSDIAKEGALEKGGGLVFVYGPRESKWQNNTCEGQFSL